MLPQRTARVLIRKENTSEGEEWFVAQILDFDIATQARSLADLGPEIERIVVGHIVASEEEGLDPFDLPSAPQPYHDEYIASHGDWIINIHPPAGAPMKVEPPTLTVRFARGT